MDGKKIPEHLECPIDTFILNNIVIPINPIFKSMGATPNILTGISGVFGLLAVYFIYNSNYALGALMYLLSYIFDCFDGNFARTYNMVSPFGDWFDHTKDTIVHGLLLLAVAFKKDLKMSTKVLFVGIALALAMLMSIALNFQEKHYHENNEVSDEDKSKSMEFLKIFHTPDEKSHSEFFRHFGCGTHNIAVVLFLLYFHISKNKMS
jgi:phosphatidylglycerophosphate synthase